MGDQVATIGLEGAQFLTVKIAIGMKHREIAKNSVSFAENEHISIGPVRLGRAVPKYRSKKDIQKLDHAKAATDMGRLTTFCCRFNDERRIVSAVTEFCLTSFVPGFIIALMAGCNPDIIPPRKALAVC